VDTSLTKQADLYYELRFARLFNAGRGYAFPCDSGGQVDIDSLGDLARANYFYARSSVGVEFFAPITCICNRDAQVAHREFRRRNEGANNDTAMSFGSVA
jgi:hypothetical protein